MNQNAVTTYVYKYNPNANLIIIIYSICFFGFFYLLFSIGFGIIWFGLPLIIFPLYVRFSKQSQFKVRIIDKNSITFSFDGIKYGEVNYPRSQIEAVAIYLYSFDGFEFRELGIYPGANAQDTYVRASGDKNTISFRAQDNVMDFTFYLENYAQFCTLRRVLNDWISEGINVVLKQAFTDDFIMQEMGYYNTPSGL